MECQSRFCTALICFANIDAVAPQDRPPGLFLQSTTLGLFQLLFLLALSMIILAVAQECLLVLSLLLLAPAFKLLR
jgi:hypothetical protein